MSHLFRSVLVLLLVLLFITAVSAQGQTNKDMTVQSIDSPATPGSGEPSLYAAADGRVFLKACLQTKMLIRCSNANTKKSPR
jgi:hypothetical protein